MRSPTAPRLILSLCCFAVLGSSHGCGDEAGETTETLAEVPCTDESVTNLTLFDEPNPADVINDPQSDGFSTDIDATGGGLSADRSYVYMKFEDDGLKNVELSDEDAFKSLDWDIAVRRYVIRLNSGVSGPGKVKAARTKPETKFESVEKLPDGLDFRAEEYFTESCDFINDSSGIGGPGTALASFWSYSACVAMTHNVYVVELARPKKRHVKLEIMSYYYPDRQKVCDDTGMVPMPSGAGNMKWRWSFID